jgi:hypothetical protein
VSPFQQAQAEGPLQSVIKQIRQHIANPLIPMPEVQRSRRRRLYVPEDQCRRSSRLAVKSKKMPQSSIKRAQLVLMDKLGICRIEGEPAVDCLERYAAFFDGPLSQMKIEALTKMFFLDTVVPEELW